MGWNLLYALFHFALALLHGSLWYWTMAVYYLVLGLMKMSVVLMSREGSPKRRRLVMCGNAAALLFLGSVFAGITFMSMTDFRIPDHGTIVVIAFACFTFTLLSLAIRNILIARKRNNAVVYASRNIACAGAIGSVLSLERSMQAAFGAAGDQFSRVLFAVSGMVAFMLILILSYSMFRHRNDEMDPAH